MPDGRIEKAEGRRSVRAGRHHGGEQMFTADDTLEFLRELVQAKTPNPPGDIRAAAVAAARLLDREGIPYETHESAPGVTNLVATIQGSGPGKTLMFNGHLDVIPAGTGWEWDPYGGHFEDGYVHGRGSCDMKAGVAAVMNSLVNLRRRGTPFNGTIKLWLVGDEEFEGRLGTQYLLAQGQSADCAVICEPTDMKLVLGNRGLLWADVVVHGRASHGGRPRQGINAVHVACRIIDALSALPLDRCRDDRFEVPVSSISAVCISGG
jgi:succinyl-diaminopimelate desuccinylase